MAATRRRSATTRILLLVLVVITVATAIAWRLNDATPPTPAGTIAAGPAVATVGVPVVLASPTGAPSPVAAATLAPTVTPVPTPTPTPMPSPTPTATPPPTATPLPTMTPTPVVVSGCVEPAALPAVVGPTQFVSETGINLRQQPGLNCAIVVPIQQFTELTAVSGPVQADGLSWIKVEVAGFTGWVATDNIREPANG